MGAVATRKAFNLDLHLFSLEVRSNSNHGDDDLSVAGSLDGVSNGFPPRAPDQLCDRATSVLKVFQAKLIGVTVFERHWHQPCFPRLLPCVLHSIVEEQLSIEQKAKTIVSLDAQFIFAGIGRNQLSSPAHREAFPVRGWHWALTG